MRTDASPLDAALREAEEEVGLTREFVDPIGYLDLYGTSFGFRILPTVARFEPGFTLRISPTEVDDAFEVPLAFLMNSANHQLQSKEFRGVEGFDHAMPYGERYIWGATAGILRVLYERIFTPDVILAFTQIGIFLIPFVVYALFLVASRSGLLMRSSWPVVVIGRLLLGSLLLVVLSLILLAQFTGAAPHSTYVPAHLENGKLIPGVEK